MQADVDLNRRDAVARCAEGVVSFTSIGRKDWKSQTHLVRNVFVVGAMIGDIGESRLIQIDGHIRDDLKRDAFLAPSVAGFFNARFHSARWPGRRLLVFDTVSTGKMARRGVGRGFLHFHGLFEVPEGWERGDWKLMRAALERVFGKAERTNGDELIRMGKRQFNFRRIDWSQGSTRGDLKAYGPVGNLFYAVKDAGSTYCCLDLNEGVRQRKVPASAKRNRGKASGIAAPTPSNFMDKIAIRDRASLQAGRSAFADWVKVQRARPAPVRRKLSLNVPVQQSAQ